MEDISLTFPETFPSHNTQWVADRINIIATELGFGGGPVMRSTTTNGQYLLDAETLTGIVGAMISIMDISTPDSGYEQLSLF